MRRLALLMVLSLVSLRSPAASNTDQEDLKLLEAGKIEQLPYVAGALVGTFSLGGVGHFVQGRFGERGWVFALETPVALGMIAVGSSSPDFSNSVPGRVARIMGWLALVALHSWEVWDLWTAPLERNARYDELKQRNIDGTPSLGAALYLAPTSEGTVRASVQWTF